MVSQPGRYFLSRPRRFGKSLLLDTFKSLFEAGTSSFLMKLFQEQQYFLLEFGGVHKTSVCRHRLPELHQQPH
ncbi:AAA family ATPase [Spirochaeta africana]|uniref:AAA family ATPase n=1 Tax=Spirochaeta africana TaxID=46355 RepID=UPI000A070B86|nr:AAA family ATPase [Spirochaeta africana]